MAAERNSVAVGFALFILLGVIAFCAGTWVGGCIEIRKERAEAIKNGARWSVDPTSGVRKLIWSEPESSIKNEQQEDGE